MSPFAEQYDRAEPLERDEPTPIVKATPYVWREPSTLPRRPWIYGRQIMRAQVGGKFAPGAAGKTTHEVGLCLALATGRDFMGERVWGGPKRVWLWNLEDSTDELSRIIQATAMHWGISKADIDGRLFVDSALDGAMLKLATQTNIDGLIINEPVVDALIAELKARQIDYLSIDPFISSHSVEENDNNAIDAVVKKWAFIGKSANCAISLSHHVSKAGSAEVTAASARGASSLVAACRSALVLNRMSDKEAEGWGIGSDERRRFFRVYDDKNNRAPPAASSDWFHLVSVDLGNADPSEGAPSDSIGVVEPWYPPDAFEDVTVADLIAVQEMIHSNPPARENVQAVRWVGKMAARALGLDLNDKAALAKVKKLVRTWISNGALVVVEKLDEHSELKKFVEVGKWADGRSPAAVSVPPHQQVRKGAEGAGDSAPKSSVPVPPPLGGTEVRKRGDASGGGVRVRNA